MNNHKEDSGHFTEALNNLLSPPSLGRMIELFPDGPPDQAMADLYNPADRMLEVFSRMDGFEALDAAGHFAQAGDRLAAASAWSEGEDWKDLKKIDNGRQYYVTLPSGTQIKADKRSRNHWSLTVISPPSPNGKTIKMTQNVPGDESAIYISIGQVAEDILRIRQSVTKVLIHYASEIEVLRAAAQRVREEGGVIDEGDLQGFYDESEDPMIQIMLSSSEVPFDVMYERFNTRAEDVPAFTSLKSLEHLRTFHSTGRDLIILGGIAIHEVWKKLANVRYTEDREMAKNTGGMNWWEITGGRTPLNKIVNSLTHNRHMVVLDNKERIYLRVQNSEQRFVDQITSKYNCRAKLVDEPEYGETLCGKFHQQPELHSHRCNACQRIKSNEQKAKAQEEAAHTEESIETQIAQAEAIQRNKASIKREVAYPSTTSPDGVFTSGLGSTLPVNPIIPPPYLNERQEWDAKNGPIITVQGPAQKESNDIQGLAEEYRRVADELMERASYYATLAEKYETLLLPTDAVKEAEEALEAARAKDREDRAAQIKDLQDMLAAGPPSRLEDRGETNAD
jgi:hypothetical protein